MKAELGRPAHEEDHFVLRGPEIPFEGYFDVRPSAIKQTAYELGMKYRHQYDDLLAKIDALEIRNAALEAEAKDLSRKYAQMLEMYQDAIRGEESYGLLEDLEASEWR